MNVVGDVPEKSGTDIDHVPVMEFVNKHNALSDSSK